MRLIDYILIGDENMKRNPMRRLAGVIKRCPQVSEMTIDEALKIVSDQECGVFFRCPGFGKTHLDLLLDAIEKYSGAKFTHYDHKRIDGLDKNR